MSKKKVAGENPLTLEEAINLLQEAERLIHEPPMRDTGEISVLPVADRSDFLTPKAELCARIVRVMKMGMERYYKRFPDRENDQRAIESAFWSAAGVRVILMLIDGYEIGYKDRNNHTKRGT